MPPALSCQLYSFRDAGPLAPVLAQLAGLGLRHVEPFAAQLADPAGLRDLLADHGLTAPSFHIGIAALRADADAVMRALATLGTELAVLAYLAPELRPADWRGFATELAGYAAAAARHGLRFAWHNHDFEFTPQADGTIPLDHLLAAPGVLWQCDLAWLIRAGADPAAWLARHGIAGVHMKDLDAALAAEDGWADLGHGTIAWDPLLPALRAVPLWVLEHDRPADPGRFAARSAATAKAWITQ